MPQPSRDEAIATLEEGCALIDGLLARLSEGQTIAPRTIGGGDWSAKDLLGHVAFWEELALQAHAAWRDGRRPEAEAIFSGTQGVDEANAANQARTAAQPLEEVRARAVRAHAGVVEAIRATTDEAWLSRAPYPTERRGTLAALLGSVLGAPKRPFGHAFAHLGDLEAYVSSLG